MHAMIHTIDIQHHDGSPFVLAEIIQRFPRQRRVIANGLNRVLKYSGRHLVRGKDSVRR